MAQTRVKARAPRQAESVLRRALRALRRVSAHRGVDRGGLAAAWSPIPPPSPPGRRHLRRRTTHEGGGWREFVADFRAAVRGGWLVGLAGWAAAGAVWVDVLAVRAGIPGGPFVGAVGIFALIGLVVAVLRAAAVWEHRAPAGGRCSRPPAAGPSATPPGPSCSSAGWPSWLCPPGSFCRWRSPSSGPSRRRPSPWRSGTGTADERCPRTRSAPRRRTSLCHAPDYPCIRTERKGCIPCLPSPAGHSSRPPQSPEPPPSSAGRSARRRAGRAQSRRAPTPIP